MDWYVLALNPEPWKVGPAGVARKGGKLVPYIGRDQQLAAYKEAIAESIMVTKTYEFPIMLRFFFWRNRASYETPQARQHRKHEADLTNLQKATEDALQGVLFKNDKDVTNIKSRLMAQGSDIPGRIVIGVSVDDEPIELPENVETLLNALTDFIPPISENSWNPEVKEF